jgi:hypothetical protein
VLSASVHSRNENLDLKWLKELGALPRRIRHLRYLNRISGEILLVDLNDTGSGLLAITGPSTPFLTGHPLFVRVNVESKCRPWGKVADKHGVVGCGQGTKDLCMAN